MLTVKRLLSVLVLSSRALAGSVDISSGEVLPLEQQRLPAGQRQRVGKAIAVIQRGGMTSLAVSAPGATRGVHLFGIDRDDLRAELEQPNIELTSAGVAQPRFEHDGGFEHGRRGDQTDGIIRNPLLELRRISLVSYGRGSGHPAGLNFGDVFSYALAKVRGLTVVVWTGGSSVYSGKSQPPSLSSDENLATRSGIRSSAAKPITERKTLIPSLVLGIPRRRSDGFTFWISLTKGRSVLS